MRNAYRFGLILGLMLVLGDSWMGISQAATPYETGKDVEGVFAEWLQAHPGKTPTALDLQRYILDKRALDHALPPYAQFQGRSYQPLHILPSGGWLMGFAAEPAGGVNVMVDLEGGSAPKDENMKVFVMNATGQVVRVKP